MVFNLFTYFKNSYVCAVSPSRSSQSSYTAYGHTIIASPWGNVIQELEHEEGILFQELDMDEIQNARLALPYCSQRRTDLYKLERVRN